MLRLKQAINVCILASAFLPSVVTHAATYYVATTGNNSNPGTSSQPWRTVVYATSKMVAGDTTYVKGGMYNEGAINFTKTGTQSAPIKLLNAPGEFPIINFINRSQYHRINIRNGAGSTKKIGWITIEGFELRNGSEGMKIENGHDLTIRRNWIHHNKMGIVGNGTRILIDRNKINHNGNFTTCSTCNTFHGIYAYGSAWAITNNLIYDNLSYGIQVNGSYSSTYTPTKHAAPEFAGAKNWIISNNTFAYQNNRSGIVLWGSQCLNTRIENNIFYENSVKLPSPEVQGIMFSSAGGSGHTIRNNLAFASGTGGTKFLGSGGSYTQSGNIVNTINPKFVNAPATLPSSPNFALASGSPAVDKGLTISSIKISYPGTTRPKGIAHDVGAYEHNGSSSTTLAAPTSLQAVW